MFGFGIFDYIKIIAGLVIGAGLVFFPARWIGQSEGKQMAATAALSKSVTLLRERTSVNDQISAADASSLCSDFELSDGDKAECMRRISSPTAAPDDRDLHHPEGPPVRKPDCQPQ
jgi:hypothetical protein